MITFDYIAKKIVFQRDNTGSANVAVSGSCGGNAITVTFTPVQGGELATKSFKVVSGRFSGNIRLKTGDYNLTAVSGSDSLTVERVGVGEVFGFWGHSFLQGDTDTNARANVSELGRVLTATNVQTRTDTPLSFEKVTLTQKIGNFEASPYFYGELLDNLTSYFNCPVLLYNTAFGGSNISQNYGVIKGIPFTHGFIDYSKRMPLRPLEVLMERYVPITGLRALCIEHGLNDKNVNDGNDFQAQFIEVLNYVRTKYSVPNLAYFLAKEGVNFAGNKIATAQQNIIDTYPNAYLGMDFNNPLTWESPFVDLLSNNGHPANEGLSQLATDWTTGIKTNTAKTTPVLPVENAEIDNTIQASTTDTPTTDTPAQSLVSPFVWVSVAVLLLLFIALSKQPKNAQKTLKATRAIIGTVILFLFISVITQKS